MGAFFRGLRTTSKAKDYFWRPVKRDSTLASLFSVVKRQVEKWAKSDARECAIVKYARLYFRLN